MVQTILGSGGAIGLPLAKALNAYTSQIRLVGRNPKKVNETDSLFPADVKDMAQIDKAIEGSSVVYVTIGFEYKTSVWEAVWPAFLQQVIDSCIRHQAKLVFFDNVYMYAGNAIPFMTEAAPIQPHSRKGQVRARLHHMIMETVEKGKLSALIARAADFYGPDNKNSALNMMVAENLMKGKKAQAFGDVNKIHTYTYTPDAGRATAVLGNTPEAYNQVWHVPTTREKLTNMDWIKLIAKELGTEPKVQQVPKWMLHVLGIFIPIMREFPEMLYQYEQDYIFDSSKFEQKFGWSATPPAEGIMIMLDQLKQRSGLR